MFLLPSIQHSHQLPWIIIPVLAWCASDAYNLCHWTNLSIKWESTEKLSCLCNTEFSHSLREECTDTLLDVMDQHLRMIEDDCYHYKMYSEKLKKEADFDLQALTNELDNLTAEEKRLMEDLKALQDEEKQIDQDIVKAEEEKKTLQFDAERFWREYNKYARDLYILARTITEVRIIS